MVFQEMIQQMFVQDKDLAFHQMSVLVNLVLHMKNVKLHSALMFLRMKHQFVLEKEVVHLQTIVHVKMDSHMKIVNTFSVMALHQMKL